MAKTVSHAVKKAIPLWISFGCLTIAHGLDTIPLATMPAVAICVKKLWDAIGSSFLRFLGMMNIWANPQFVGNLTGMGAFGFYFILLGNPCKVLRTNCGKGHLLKSVRTSVPTLGTWLVAHLSSWYLFMSQINGTFDGICIALVYQLLYSRLKTMYRHGQVKSRIRRQVTRQKDLQRA